MRPLPSAAIAVLAKSPAPGRVKTRLWPPCTAEEAAAIAEAALRDTLDATATSSATRRVLVLDGPPGPWCRSGFDVVAQRGVGLGARLSAAFEDVGGPALVVGMDTPQVSPRLLDAALAALCADAVDAVLGLAEDGGYWAIGLRGADRRVFEHVPMSAPDTGRRQLCRLRELGLSTTLLPRLRDVDHIDDALAVAELIPASCFAQAVRVITGADAMAAAL